MDPTLLKTFKQDLVALKYGELACTTTTAGRIYMTPEGRRYPSITTVLSILSEEWVREWRARVGDEAANRAGRLGTSRGKCVHAFTESLLKNESPDVSALMPHLQASFKSLIPVFEEHVDNIKMQERMLYSDHLGIGGRVDLVAEWDGIISIVDVKTSNRIKSSADIESYFLQETAYAIMFEERTGIPVSSIVTVMAVDGSSPLVFKENRDNWTEKLIKTIAEYKKRKMFGH